MVPKIRVTRKKKKEGASAMSKRDSPRWRKRKTLLWRREMPQRRRRKTWWRRREIRRRRVKSWWRRGSSTMVFTMGPRQIQPSRLGTAREKPHLHRTFKAVFPRNHQWLHHLSPLANPINHEVNLKIYRYFGIINKTGSTTQ